MCVVYSTARCGEFFAVPKWAQGRASTAAGLSDPGGQGSCQETAWVSATWCSCDLPAVGWSRQKEHPPVSLVISVSLVPYRVDSVSVPGPLVRSQHGLRGQKSAEDDRSDKQSGNSLKGPRPGDLPLALNRNAAAKWSRGRESQPGTPAGRPANTPEMPKTWFPLRNTGDIFGSIEAGLPRSIQKRRTQNNH